MPTFFKIRDTRTGRFSIGGMSVMEAFKEYSPANARNYHYMRHWTSEGKVWNSPARLRQHLRQFDSIPPEWEVVRLEAKEMGTAPANEFLEA